MIVTGAVRSETDPRRHHPPVGAVLAEQHDEWAERRRYLGLDVLARSRMTHIPGDTDHNVANNSPAEEVAANEKVYWTGGFA